MDRRVRCCIAGHATVAGLVGPVAQQHLTQLHGDGCQWLYSGQIQYAVGVWVTDHWRWLQDNPAGGNTDLFSSGILAARTL